MLQHDGVACSAEGLHVMLVREGKEAKDLTSKLLVQVAQAAPAGSVEGAARQRSCL